MQDEMETTIRPECRCSHRVESMRPKGAINHKLHHVHQVHHDWARSSTNTAIRWLLVILSIAIFTTTAIAGTQDNVYSVGLATRNIYLVNANGTVTNLFTNYTGTSSAAMAVRASDGVVFFITQVANGPVFTWNPATPATAPVQIGTTGAAVAYIPRLAFSAAGVLYAVDTDTTNIYTSNQATAAAT